MMRKEQVLRLPKILYHLVTREPKIILQRVEEIFPSLKEILVSAKICVCARVCERARARMHVHELARTRMHVHMNKWM
jgi:hypothetical protein